MKPPTANPESKEERILRLVDLLQSAERELQELCGGELDAVVSSDRGAFLLRDAQLALRRSEAAHREFAAQQAAILNALPAHVALLDSEGRIVAVNELWRKFGAENGLTKDAVGASYLEVCDSGGSRGDRDSMVIGQGIRAVLEGRSDRFSVDYPCHSPTEQRWFRLMAAPIRLDHGIGAVVMHVNVTQEMLDAERHAKNGKMLATAVRMAGLGSWDYDLISGRLEWSDETLQIFGISREEWGGTFEHFLAFLHPEDQKVMRKQDRSSLEVGSVIEAEYRITRPSGEARLVYDRGETALDTAGRPVRRFGMVLDVTERRRAEAVLREAEERFRNVSENIVEVIWITDVPKNRMLYVSPQYEKIWARSRQSLYDRPHDWIDGIHPEDRERIRSALSKQVKGSYDETYRIQRPDGAIRWVRDRAYPVRNELGEVFRIVGMAEDVTERMRHDELTWALSRLGQQLATATTAREAGETIANAADELFGWDALTLDLYNEETGLMSAVLTKDSVDGRRVDCARANEQAPPSARSREVMDAGAKLILRKDPSTEVPPEAMFGDKTRISMSIMLVPVREGAKSIGVISIQSYRQNAYSQRDLDGLQLLGDYCGGALNRIRSESLRKESESKFRRLTESNVLGTMMWDQSGIVADANDAFLQMVGYTREDLRAGKIDWKKITPPEYRHLDEQALAELAASGRCRAYEKEYWRKDRTRVPILIGAATLGGTDQKGICYVIDLSARRKAEASLRESEERFRLMARATNDAIWDWDLKSNALWWNDGFETLFGFARAAIEPTIESWTRRIHPGDHDTITQSVHRAIEEGRTFWSGEYRFRRKDGSYAWVLDRGHVIRDESGQAVRMIGGMTDLSERRRYEEQLAEQAALLDSAHEAILVKDLQDRIIYWNRGAERTYGWPADEAVGKETLSLIYRGSGEIRNALALLLKNGEWQGEVAARNKAGKDLRVDVRWTLMRDQEGQPKSILEISSDITEKKRLETQFLRAQRMESLGTLAGGIAHDLNNVLAPILMSIEVLKIDEKDEDRLDMLETIHRSAVRGGDLVRQVLAFARGFAGNKLLVNPLHMVREILKITGETFPKNISVKTKVDSNLWPIMADPTQIHQVLMNLCVNARDALPSGGQITIGLRNLVVDEIYAGMNPGMSPGPCVELRVEDNGTGMSQEVKDRIFDPFFTTKEVGKGTGLGLATVQSIVKGHGGSIHVYSEMGRGTMFKIYLPATTDSQAVDASAPEETLLPSGKGETILVVDDEESIRFLAKRTLEKHGYKVLLAPNGAEALAIYVHNSSEISAVLTDMAMPIMDGPATITALRSLAPDIKIIGSSGVASNESVSKAMGAGVEHFIPKPYTAETLLRTLHKILHQTAVDKNARSEKYLQFPPARPN